jgi:choline/glycine/proline betaine transport protein
MKQAAPSFDAFISLTALGVLLLVVLATAVDIEATRAAMFGLQDRIVENFAWLFSLTVSGILVFTIWLACSRYGGLRLGPDHARPQYSTLSWLAMLFSAGMGIGLIFFGVAEPVLHFLAPLTTAAGTPDAAREALRLSVFHWGLHAWGIYALVGLALALFHFRYHQPLALRSLLQPWLRTYTHRWPGKLVDTVAVLGTLFGLATSLGLGAIQINAGLFQLFGIAIGATAQTAIIVIVTLCATTSLVLGLDTGIKRLSEFNMVLAGLLLLFVLALGPTSALLRGIPDTLGSYLQNLPGMSFRTHPFRDMTWQKSWTIFYWAWWLSWAPFVGTFIARISRGRTVREFILGVLLVPSVLSLLWFSVFGGAALHAALSGAQAVTDAVQRNTALAIYALLEQFPWADLTHLITIAAVAVFFITSSDSASFVVDMLASGGDPDPPVVQRIFWASLEGVLAIVLLGIGGLDALQAGAVSLGLPVCLFTIAAALCLLHKLREESCGRVAAMRASAE